METTDRQEARQRITQKLKWPFKLPAWILAVVAVAVILVGVVALPAARQGRQSPEVITVSTLREIVNVSKLSTYTAVYNGIAQVMNEEDPEEIDYYVSYEAKVYAGIDFETIEIQVDDEEKMIYVELPEVDITKVDVDIASMDFIFYNDKANASTVSQEAYRACEIDAQEESEKQMAIYELARQNAYNVLTALIKPLIEQVDAEFGLSVI